jgi:DNA-binding beta-propeller fold protein YncE
MKSISLLLSLSLFVVSYSGAEAQPAPLKLAAREALPVSTQGRFDHLGVNYPGNRLFLAAESEHRVLILNLRTGKYVGNIPNVQIPHTIFVRQDVNRMYVTDGGTGGVRIYNATSYQQIGFIQLKKDTDSVAWDPRTKYLYVVNGGGDAQETFSMYSVIDTNSDKKLADIRIDGDTLEASVVDPSSSRIFVNNPAKNEIDVIDRNTRKVVAVWPITMGTKNVAMALDPATHRLFIGCRSGRVVVVDTQTGKELQTLNIGGDIDDLIFDPVSKRIYASCGGGDGSTSVYQEESADHYKLLGTITTAPGAKNEALVPQLGRYYTIAPPTKNPRGALYVFAVQ